MKRIAFAIAIAVMATTGTAQAQSFSGEEATWYGTGTGPGYAAYKSELKGSTLKVCNDDTGACVTVEQDDTCPCRHIDLYPSDFSAIASGGTSEGRLQNVSVSVVGSESYNEEAATVAPSPDEPSDVAAPAAPIAGTPQTTG